MTDNDIIKALECCSHQNMCRECPCHNKGTCWGMKQNAIDLINRQKAEIEMLKGWERLLKAESHALIKAEAVKKFANELRKGRVSNGPAVIAVNAELNAMKWGD